MNGKKNPKYVQAQKEGKVDYSTIPFSVLADDARAHSEGANKYGRFNWTRDEIEARTYIAAICRHLFGDPATNTLGWVNGEDIDPDSGLNHLTKIRACCALVMDAQAKGKLIDNRLEAESKSEEPNIADLINQNRMMEADEAIEAIEASDAGKDREVEKQYAVLERSVGGLGTKLHGPYTYAEAANRAKVIRAMPKSFPINVTIHELTTTE